jgi:hypothetical protein
MLGEQKDIGEFNLNFLERIEEGLGERLESKKIASKDPQGEGEEEQKEFMDRLIMMNEA